MLQLPTTKDSFWREFYTDSKYPELTEDLEVDVAIVGAGITGLTSAYLLKESGLTVAVLDKSTVGGGTTGRTTGKVTSQHNLVYADLERKFGAKTARIYGQANQEAIEQIAAIVKAEGIECNWIREDNYVYTTDEDKVSLFKNEATVAIKLGLPASFETNTPLPINVAGAVKFTNQYKINTQKYLLGLAKAVNGSGSYVFENSNVTGIRDGDPGHIKTSKAKIVAKSIIVATNVPAFPLVARGGYCVLEYPKESYIIAAKLPESLSGMYISPDKHNYSLLPVSKGRDQLLLVGGGGHVSGLTLSHQAHWQKLANYAEKHFGVTEIINKWSDRDYLAYDGIPLIGKLYPWSKNTYVGTAFMKWGLSNGTVAAMILTDTIRGKENAWAATYNSNRLRPIAHIPSVIVQNAKSLLP